MTGNSLRSAFKGGSIGPNHVVNHKRREKGSLER